MILEHEAAIRESWAAIRPAAAQVAHRFYARLFELDPTLRPLFQRSDPEALERKLVAALDEIVRLTADPARLVSVIVPLGRRHAAYGVKPQGYDTATAALLAALRDMLGDRFTPEVESGWREVHKLVSAVMQRAASTPA